jgi:two-component system, NarL family, response regulator NreC
MARDPGRIRIVVADDHAMVRAGLRLLVDRQPDMTVVGEAGDGAEAAQRVAELKPDVLVLDLCMPRTDPTETIRRVTRRERGTAVVVLSVAEGDVYARAAAAAGALGYVSKASAERELLAAVRAAAAGRAYRDAAVRRTSRPAPRGGEGRGQRLSPRETEALRLLALGYSNRQAAERMRVSAKTVETFRSRLSKKLGLSGRPALVRFALRSGLVDIEDAATGTEGDD